MIHEKILLCLLVLQISGNAFAKQCDSCVQFRHCPEAINFSKNKNNSAKEKFLEASCGIKIENGKRYPMVCCSDYIQQPNRVMESDIEIKRHKNIELLPETCGGINGDRIIGGLVANLYEFPWMALISHYIGRGKTQLQFQCGGTIINSRYILTAAHCVKDKRIAGVRLGEFDTSARYDCQGEDMLRVCESHIQDVRVSKAIVHEDYTVTPHVKHDIALLRLKKPIIFSYRNIGAVCLPLFNDLRNISLDGKRGTVIGWGITEFKKASSVLRKVEVPILTDNECQEYYNNSGSVFCAGERGVDSCKGDSGGPLMMEEEYKSVYRMIQFGVVSYGPEQCGSYTPAVYTDVRRYIKWILDNIEP